MTRSSDDVFPVTRPVRPELAPPRPAARRTRRGMRLLLALLVVAGAAYASLPWWLPTDLIRSRIAAELRRATGCDAEVGRCTAGWRDGVVLGDISILDPVHRVMPLVSIREVRADFSPIRLLCGLGLSTLEVIAPIVRADIDATGRLGLVRLKLGGGDPPPLRDIIIRDARVDVTDARSGEQTHLDLADVRLGLDRSTGRLDVRIAGDLIREIRTEVGARQRSSTAFGSEAALILPTLSADGKAATDLSGEGRLHWNDIDLSSLPIQMLPGMTIARLAGRCGGEIRASIGPQLDQSLAVSLRLANVSFAGGRSEAIRFDEATIEAAGRWRPAYDLLELKNWDIRMPGIEAHGRAVDAGRDPDSNSKGDPVMIWSLRGEQAVRAAFAGRIDAPRLAQAVKSEWLAASRGALRFDGRIDVGREKTVWSARFSGEGLETPPHAPISLSSSERVELSIRGVEDTAGDYIVVEELAATLGESRVRGSVGLPLNRSTSDDPQAWLTTWFEKGWIDLAVECDDLSRARDRFASLRNSPTPFEIEGVGRAAVWLGATPRGRVARFSAGLSPTARLIVPGLIEKPVGVPLQVDFASRYGDDPGTLVDLRLTASAGPGRIESLPDANSYFRFAVRRESVGEVPGNPDAVEPNSAFSIDIASAIGLKVADVQHWCALLPALRSALQSPSQPNRPFVSGDLSASLVANLRHRAAAGTVWPELYRVSAAVNGDRLAIDTGPGFEKPGNEPARADLQYWFDRSRARSPHRVRAKISVDGGGLDLRVGLGGGAAEFDATLDATDVVRLARHADWFERLVASQGLTGAASGRIRYAESPEGGERTIALDLSQLGIAGSQDGRQPNSTMASGLSKRPGVPCRLDASFRLARSDPSIKPADSNALRWDVVRLNAVLAASELKTPRGSVLFDQRFESRVLQALADGRPESLLSPDAGWRARLSANAMLVADDNFRSFTLARNQSPDAFTFDGRCRATIDIDATPRVLRLSGRTDAAGLGIGLNGSIAKRSGSPASLAWDLELHAADRRAGAEPLTRLVARDLSLELAGGRLSVRGEAALNMRTFADSTIPNRVRSANIDATFGCSDLSTLAHDARHLLPGGWRLEHVAGGAAGNLSITFDGSAWRLKPSDFVGRNFVADIRPPGATTATPVRLDGRVAFDQESARTDGIDVAIGQTRVRIAGDVRDFRDGVKGEVILSGANLDAIEIRKWPAGSPSDDPASQQRAMLEYLRKCDVRLTAHFVHALFDGFTADTTFPVDELSVDAFVNASRVDASFACAANDGWVRGSWKLPLDVSDPFFDLEYEARDLTAEKNTRPLVEAFFPGLAVRGRVTLVDQSHQRLIAPSGAANYPTGTGEMVLTDGTTVGRAAPLWVTKVFPGLNLASFEFTEMINRFEKLSDGTHNNHMTFYGSYYHLYVDGYSKANGEIRYEVGVDLLARVSPDLSRIGQGRVALFIKTGKIRNGVLEDEVVSYLTPVQVTEKILSNNVLTVAYYAVKKQVTGL